MKKQMYINRLGQTCYFREKTGKRGTQIVCSQKPSKEDLEAMGLTRITEVERSQQKIVSVVKRLEEEGRIVVGGGEELV